MTVRSGAQLVVIRRAIYSRPAFAESMRHILCPRDAWVPSAHHGHRSRAGCGTGLPGPADCRRGFP